MPQLVTLVADAGRKAGLGHISRSSAVAVALRCHGVETSCYAYEADEPFDWDGIVWTPLSDGFFPDARGHVLVVDAYHLPPDVVARAAERNLLVVMHDYGEPPADVALVVTVAGEASSDRPRRMAGPEYAALRPGFWGMPERLVRERVERVLVTTGSGRLEEVGCELAQALADVLVSVSVSLVRGPDATRDAPDGVDMLDAPRSLVEPLLRSDLVVCGAGQTMLEAAAAGTPCIALSLAENQRLQGLRLAELGAVQLIDPPDASRVTAAASKLVHDVGARRSLSREGQRCVDGYGALRVAFEIARLAQ